MNLSSLVIQGLLAAGLSLLAQSLLPAQEKAADLAAMQGTWKVVGWQDKKLEQIDETIRKDLQGFRIVFKGDKMIWTGKESLEKTVTLDATRSPKTIDLSWQMPMLTFAQVGEAAQTGVLPKKLEPMTVTLPGIYKLEGNRLTIAVTDRVYATTRPRDFRFTVDPPTFVFVLERVK